MRARSLTQPEIRPPRRTSSTGSSLSTSCSSSESLSVSPLSMSDTRKAAIEQARRSIKKINAMGKK